MSATDLKQRLVAILLADTSGAGRAITPQGYSITRSARTRIERGIVMPSALAVFILITSSNFVGCSTRSSAGLAPLMEVLFPVGTAWGMVDASDRT